MKQITFITGNAGKFKEAQTILGNSVDLIQVNIDLYEIQTISVKEVIKYKIKEGYAKVKGPIIVEDTGLEFDAWNGLPGALVKFFLKSVGVEGLIKMLGSYENKNAKAVCYIGYFDGKDIMFFDGEVSGTISTKVLGDNGFQFDRILIPNGSDKTFAQMTAEEKNKISHRKRAFEKFKEYLDSNISKEI